ncbi:MAG: hypothetical protein IT436_12625 [Phycisphaerales bacterium]|nr:hypothetical protein [Phycisphaerales bacterium]
MQRDTHADFGIEPLEPRLVMAASFAGAGLYYLVGSDGQEVLSFATEGQLSDSLAAAGSRYKSGSGDREFEGDLRYDSIRTLADGRFERSPAAGFFGEPEEVNGAQYLSDDGFPAGWYFGQYSVGSKELELLVQRPVNPVARADFQGDYQFSAMWNHPAGDGVGGGSGRLTISSSELAYSSSAGAMPYTRSSIRSTTSAGLLTTVRDEYVYLGATESTIVWADLDSDDGILAMGIATRQGAPAEASAMVGGYLLAWNNEVDSLDFRQYFLELEADGDYKFYDLDEYDDGIRESIDRGFWSVSGTTLTLQESDGGPTLRFAIGEGNKLLVGQSRVTGGVTYAAFGVGTRAEVIPPGPTVVFPVAARNAAGQGVVYELESDDAWHVTNLVEKAGGPAITGRVVTWTDPKDNLTYAAGLSASGLVLYTSTDEHVWTYRVLTSEASATKMTGELQVMTGPDRNVHLTGLSATGEVLRHYQTGVRDGTGKWVWAFQNITTNDLTPQSLTTPAFTGLVSYATAWNGLNIAGLDSEGTIWSVWWAPGLAAWTVSDLTTTYGAAPLSGGLTVYLTPWQGINIAGIDSAGHLQVTWWVPSLGGTWNQNDLTDLTAGPLLAPSTVTSYVSSWGGLNVAGIDGATGDLYVYWWSPSSPGGLWAASSLTAVTPADAPRLTGPLTGVAAPDSSLNVFGYNGTNFIRYFWEPSGAWMTQNLTAIAAPR